MRRNPLLLRSRRLLAAGEAVLWRERRAPPFMQLACALAAVIGISGVAAQNVIVTPLAVLVAVALVLIGRRVAARHYLEDQVLTDRRALVVPRRRGLRLRSR